MPKWIFLGTAVSLAACGVAAQERLSKPCRAEVIELCAVSRDRSAFAACLMEKQASLSTSCRSELRARVAGADGRGGRKTNLGSAAQGGQEISYGDHRKQNLDYYPAKISSGKPAPLVIFIHGGGWSIGDKKTGTGTKAGFYNDLGFNFASLNYRLVPEVKPDAQAADIAKSIAYLRSRATGLGFDPDQIYVMGHSAGAHLAALVSTDTRYLATAGVPVSALKGTILLDGAGYDVVAQMAYKGNLVQGMYNAAFGKDPATQAALSPVTHVAAPNAANWLIMHVDSRPDARKQSEALGNALTANGARVSVLPVPNSSHSSVNRDAGTADTFTGNAIAKFLGQHR